VYDYSRPPHRGKLNYEAWQWPVTGAGLCRAFQSVAGQADLRLANEGGRGAPAR
jgi:hypothetical protein